MQIKASAGVFIAPGVDAQGRREIATLPWESEGFVLRPSAHPFRRAALFSEQPRARIDLRLPAGAWRLVFNRHDWSGSVLVRDAVSHAVHDLFKATPDSDRTEVPVTSAGPDTPVSVEVAAQRDPAAKAGEVWLLEVHGSNMTFHPEAGVAVSPSCRLIEGVQGRYLALRTDVGVADCLAATGEWEPEQVELFSRLVREGEGALDVGANMGCHTVALSKLVGPRGQVLAFEPQAQMFNLLSANLALNDCRNVLAYRIALGAREDRMQMGGIVYDDFLPFGSVSLQYDRSVKGHGEKVSVAPLDAFLPPLEIAVPFTLMKIDVQAYELFVLQGARKFLAEHTPSISFEVSPFQMRGAGYDWREILSLLREFGYSFYDDKRAPLDIPEWDGQSLEEWQFLAVAPRYRERLR